MKARAAFLHLSLLFGFLGNGCSDRDKGFFDFSREPQGEVIRLAEGWESQGLRYRGWIGETSLAAARFGETCEGYVGEKADFTLRLREETALQMRVESTLDEDLVMVVTGRAGLRCNDDDVGLMPGMQTRLSAGTYSVYVGSLKPEVGPIPYAFILEPAHPNSPFQGVSSAEVTEQLDALDDWPTPVTAGAVTELVTKLDAQEARFQEAVPTAWPDLDAEPRHGTFRLQRDSQGLIFHDEFESPIAAAMWQAAPNCGGYVPARGTDIVLRATTGFDREIVCEAESTVAIELGLRDRNGTWACGREVAEGRSLQRFRALGPGDYALLVRAIEPVERHRVVLRCDMLEEN